MDKKNAVVDFGWVQWMIAERESQGWSQADLAREAGVTRQTINDYEGERRANPDPKILSRISAALGYGELYLPRLAGLIPQVAEDDAETEAIANEAKKLNQQDRQEVLAFIRMKTNMRKRSK